MFKSWLITLMESTGIMWLSRYSSKNRPMILMYHRITSEPNMPGIPEHVFESQLIYLKKHFHVITMGELYENLINNCISEKTVVLTFDDGHIDFYNNAWPLIKKHNLTASIYITTGFIDKKCWLWPDLLRFLLLKTEQTLLDLPETGKLHLSKENVLQIWSDLGDICLTLTPKARDLFLQKISTQLSVAIPSQPQAPFDPLTWQMLKEMEKQGLDIGSHSVNHPILSHLSQLELDAELLNSKERITAELGKVPIGFCYPNGMQADISDLVLTRAKEFYSYGLVAHPNRINRTKTMQLGRYAASKSLISFKLTVNGLRTDSFNIGAYR